MSRQWLIGTLLIIGCFVLAPSFWTVQYMMREGSSISSRDDDHTTGEEAEGKQIRANLQAKERDCVDITDEEFGVLGEYFMGQIVWDRHATMNNMMIQMMGETGEEQMHIVLGKQRSECEPNAPIPQEIRDNAVMGMMMGGGTRTNRRNTTPGNGFTNSLSMMHYGFAPFGWIFMLLFRGLVILGGIFLVKRLMHQQTGHHHEGKSALDILKERYAHGKIDKQEFEEKKKDLM